VSDTSFVKIRKTGAELFYADGETDVKKLIVAFRSSAKALKRQGQHHQVSQKVKFPLQVMEDVLPIAEFECQ
jgi:hypothetical protein